MVISLQKWTKVENKATESRQFPIVEIYGPVVQGEGEMIGRRTHFVRSGYCDYRCSWCDTMFSVDPLAVKENAKMMTAAEITNALNQLQPAGWITLSGGNPAIQPFDNLVSVLHNNNFQVAIETQGSIFRSWIGDCDCITVSPKPPSSGMRGHDPDFAKLDNFIERVPSSKTNLKVVIFDETDFEFAKILHLRYPTLPFTMQVGNNVGEDSTEALVSKLLWLTEKVLADDSLINVKPLPQLHTLLYANMRGK